MPPFQVVDCTKVLTGGVNRAFGNREPWLVATITATTVLGTVWLWTFINQDESILVRGKRQFFRLAKRLPAVRRKIDAEVSKAKDNFEGEIRRSCTNLTWSLELPEHGLGHDEILQLVDKHLNIGHYNWREGRVSGAVYGFNEELVELITQVYGKTSYTNPLHPDIFPGVCKMEAEVVRMACTLFHGDANSCGTMTTGGTESILMACKAYRDYARETRNVQRPNMIVPKTVHAAFDKAAQYFNIHIRYVDVDPKTLNVDVKAVKRAINSNTILLVGSAPNFPYGTIDDIEAIGALGVKYNIPVHVDACLGSFVVALTREAGYKIPPFDFAVNGVTSISADTHKYGFAPKGSSIILYSDHKYLNHQFTVTTDWPGGVYGSPTVNGSRAGGIIAACWATMMSFGHEGYLEATKRIVDTARYVEAGIRAVEGVFVFGKPATSVVAIGSNVFDIFRLSDALCKLGWNLNALQFPSGIHICITDMHTQPGVADKFLADFNGAVEEIMKDPGRPVEGKMAIYGVAQGIPDRTVVGDVTRAFLNSMYYTPNKK
ncbi:sphingosine-1-phosphate lyase [Rhagoletis pomonella]|uniref:sphingosine-1-phosphate lyase n=1 Tax=Rhagoletis pomonella TaxID=28610 RepID=UPI00177D60C0|nr:sphingosine-1-phosphate lyase [Rhagoletis pomonella]XP_036334274.1 sphingosine-1-phosphate lyase [Rhagoletis pomonella]XP_036334275.1 sphingosine-1-phosphate lyase [Rhagoletis pomonella]